MKPLYMVRYGEEKQHLEDIVNGKLRFSPSQIHVEIEKSQHNKGQGDLLEGKMRLKINSGYMQTHDTGETFLIPSGSIIIVTIQDVNNMPIFCLSQYDISDTMQFVNDNDYIISISKDKMDCVKTDFPKAKYALIIYEPDKLISDIRNITGHDVFSDEIKYYDYDINTLQMFSLLTRGTEESVKAGVFSMNYDNRHRHLLCKDISFEKQQEYRFIILDEKITTPQTYNFTFTSRYDIIPLDELEAGIKAK